MKDIFFKIIELPNHQVLVAKDFDQEDDDAPVVAVTFHLDGVKVTQKFGYAEEAKRDAAFEQFTDKDAQSIIDGMLSLMESE